MSVKFCIIIEINMYKKVHGQWLIQTLDIVKSISKL